MFSAKTPRSTVLTNGKVPCLQILDGVICYFTAALEFVLAVRFTQIFSFTRRSLMDAYNESGAVESGVS